MLVNHRPERKRFSAQAQGAKSTQLSHSLLTMSATVTDRTRSEAEGRPGRAQEECDMPVRIKALIFRVSAPNSEPATPQCLLYRSHQALLNFLMDLRTLSGRQKKSSFWAFSNFHLIVSQNISGFLYVT